ncbi:MAG TPA: DUF1569 domain-containing protein [Flavisolibacter sp.]
MNQSLFNQSHISEILQRIDKLTPAHQRRWGKMNVTQMLAHCSVSMGTAMGINVIKRVFIGRIVGSLMKRGVLGEKPFGKNAPTDKSYIFAGNEELAFEVEKAKLQRLVHEFFAGGASKCTIHPHPFFGTFTPGEWAIFQWKHLDHHLRQFGV